MKSGQEQSGGGNAMQVDSNSRCNGFAPVFGSNHSMDQTWWYQCFFYSHCAHCGEEFENRHSSYRICIKCEECQGIHLERLIESFVRHNHQRLGLSHGNHALPLFTFRHVCREIRAEFDRAWAISQVYRSSELLPRTNSTCLDVVD